MHRLRAALPGLVLAAWGGWLGAFLLYFAVAAPAARAVLGDAAVVGLVTRRVSWWFLAAAPPLAAAALPAARAAWGAGGRAPAAALALWLAAAAAQAALHPLLDRHQGGLADPLHGREAFRLLHHAYLGLAALQAGGAAWLLWLLAGRLGSPARA